MKCEVCGKGMREGVTLIRQNQKGEEGIWRCEGCNRHPVPPDLAETIAVLQQGAKRDD